MIVSAVQSAPVFLDAEATTAKVLSLIARAAGQGAELVVFPETFLPGYPAWVSVTDGAAFDCPKQKIAYAAYLDAAVEADGPLMRRIVQAARDHGTFVYLGFAERGKTHGRHSIYCSLAAIHPQKGLVGVHRKLMPTYEERLVWACGDGQGLRVHGWNGFALGGLNCWENWMPLPRQVLYELGENIHVAVWPGSSELTADISRFIALESRSYVVSSGGLLTVADVPDAFPLKDEMCARGIGSCCTGGTRIIAPDGTLLASIPDGEEGIAIAEVSLRHIGYARHNFDPAGHYSRPDVLRVRLDDRRMETLEIIGNGTPLHHDG
jgi:nitrilase